MNDDKIARGMGYNSKADANKAWTLNANYWNERLFNMIAQQQKRQKPPKKML